MESFSVGQTIKQKTAGKEWTIVDITDHLIALRERSSGTKITWFEKGAITGNIAAGVFEIV